jgi:hypothetical protein
MEELWLPLNEEFGGSYFEVSSLGRVRSTGRHVPSKSGSTRFIRARILPIRKDRDGYWKVTLNWNSQTKTPFVHRLVARAFIGVCPEGQQVRHKDGNPANSYVSNLCYGAPLQNVDDKYEHGTQKYLTGSSLPQAVIDEKIALEIDSMLLRGIRGVDIASHFGVTQQLVSTVKKGIAWSHVTGRERKRKSVREN